MNREQQAEDREMIEHENINKSSALAKFKAMEGSNQFKPPVYSTRKQTYIKQNQPPPSPTKSILKKSNEPVSTQPQPRPVMAAQTQPQPTKQYDQVPDIIKQSDNKNNDLDDCKNVSVKNIRNMWGTSNQSTPNNNTYNEQNLQSQPNKNEEQVANNAPERNKPTITVESVSVEIMNPPESFIEFAPEPETHPAPEKLDTNDFDLLKGTESTVTGFKPKPEDYISDDKPNQQELKPMQPLPVQEIG